MKLCQLETGSRSTRATIVSADRAMSLIAFPSLWLGTLAGLREHLDGAFISIGAISVRRVRSSARAETAVLRDRPAHAHDRSVEDIAAIDHQRLTGHEVRGVGQEEDHRSDQIIRLLVAFDEPAFHVSLMTPLGHSQCRLHPK